MRHNLHNGTLAKKARKLENYTMLNLRSIIIIFTLEKGKIQFNGQQILSLLRSRGIQTTRKQ